MRLSCNAVCLGSQLASLPVGRCGLSRHVAPRFVYLVNFRDPKCTLIVPLKIGIMEKKMEATI